MSDRLRLAVMVVAVGAVLAGCDGTVGFHGTTSQTLIGGVSDSMTGLRGVEVRIAVKARARVVGIGAAMSDKDGRFDFRQLSDPFGSANDFLVSFHKPGYRSVE